MKKHLLEMLAGGLEKRMSTCENGKYLHLLLLTSFLIVLYDAGHIHNMSYILFINVQSEGEYINLLHKYTYIYIYFSSFFSFYGLIAKNNSELINQMKSHSRDSLIKFM
jgi:hypothetical protein